MSVHDDQISRAARWYGLRPSSAPACPRVAAGKRCLLGNGPGRHCICERHDYPLFDHRRVWLDSGGRHVFTIEPYGAGGAEVAKLLADLHDLGLDVHFDGRSPWNPGNTLLILARLPESATTATTK